MATTLDQAAVKTAAATPTTNRLYRAVWRWHFYAGLLVIPFMVMLAVTGTIYLFKPQLDRLMYGDLLIVEAMETTHPASHLIAVTQAAYPSATIQSFRPSDAPTHSAEIKLTTAEGQSLSVFVNPYTGAVLGARDTQTNLQAIAIKLHGELLIGPAGDRLIELAACWAIILMLTGMFLWWPRTQSRLWGVFLPRLRSGRRVLWRDLHAVPGMYAFVLILVLLFSGLPWTGFWGNTFSGLATSYPAAMWDLVPQSSVPTGTLNEGETKIVPWAVEQLPLPESTIPNHQQHQQPASPSQSNTAIPQSASVSIDSIIALAEEQGVVPGYTVSIPHEPEGVYTISSFPDDPTNQATIHVDQYNGAVLADIRWKDYGWAPKAVEMGIALHEGKYFGLANQLLALFACLMIILLAISGIMMWWKRRPNGRLGAPPVPQDLPWKNTIIIITIGFGLLFPLVGMSLIVIALIDWLILARFPRLKHWLA